MTGAEVPSRELQDHYPSLHLESNRKELWVLENLVNTASRAQQWLSVGCVSFAPSSCFLLVKPSQCIMRAACRQSHGDQRDGCPTVLLQHSSVELSRCGLLIHGTSLAGGIRTRGYSSATFTDCPFHGLTCAVNISGYQCPCMTAEPALSQDLTQPDLTYGKCSIPRMNKQQMA